MGRFNKRETVKVGRERLRGLLNDENDASDAPKMVAILAISHPCSTPNQGTLARDATCIPEGESRESTPHIGITVCSTHELPCAGV
jgi:hypothetical protein